MLFVFCMLTLGIPSHLCSGPCKWLDISDALEYCFVLLWRLEILGCWQALYTNIAKTKFLCCLASLTPSINLLAAAEGSLTSPHLLPPMEPCPPLGLVWLSLAFNVGCCTFAGFVFWQLHKLIKLRRGQWAIRLAQLLLVKPHLLLKPAPALQNSCSCSHSSQNREVPSGAWQHRPANTFLWPLLLPCWLYTQARALFSVDV